MGRFYPSEEDWKVVHTRVPALLQNAVVPSTVQLDSQWTLFVNAPPRDHLPLDETQPSHSVQVFVPHHPKERRNFLNRVAREINEFRRYVANNPPEKMNLMIIRVPESASLRECSDWIAKGAIVTDKGIDQIFLYQPSVSVNRQADTTQILHHISEIRVSGKNHGNIALSVPVGIISNNPIRNILQMGERQLPLEGHHCYQRGSIYQVFPFDPRGETRARIRAIAPGVATHAVLRATDGSGMTFSGKFAPSADFSLFS